MPNRDVCAKCEDEFGDFPLVNEQRLGWRCPAIDAYHGGVILEREDPPAGCFKLFEQGVSSALDKKT